MPALAIVPLFVVTAIAEIAGCYLVYLWTRGTVSWWGLVGAAASLGLFAYLLSFHPNAARAYAAYGGAYVATAVAWGWVIEQKRPDRWDALGSAVSWWAWGSSHSRRIAERTNRSRTSSAGWTPTLCALL